MTELTVYRSEHPDVLATVERYRTGMKQWHDNSDALLKELGFTDRNFMVSSGFGQRSIAGVEYRDGDAVPVGWRVQAKRGGQKVLAPNLRTKVGQAFGAKLKACKPPNLPQTDLPGMPGDHIDGDTWRTPALREMDGAIYIQWATSRRLPEIPADGTAREEHLGDDGHRRRVRHSQHVDLSIWEHVKLSAYYAAVERQDAQEEANADG